MSNSDNPKNGAVFQKQVLKWFQTHYNADFVLEKKIPIGKPAKDHKFDIADEAGTIAIECKRFTWTETGNVPSGKMRSANEAAFYLTFLPENYEKYIVMLRSNHSKRKETLAEYYYRTNKHLLGNIKVAEYDPTNDELKIIGKKDSGNDYLYLEVIRDYLDSKNKGYNTALTEEIKKRQAGKQYTIQDHIRGMVYSLLSNQTKWHRIEPHLSVIDKLFFDYDPDKIISTDPDYFSNGLFSLKCGNICTKNQMKALSYNIQNFRRIEKEYGSIDAFITVKPTETIVHKLTKSTSPFKMKMLGEALAWEYLRNVGIDGAKPDTHLRRFFGGDRLGTGKSSPATISEVNIQVEELSKHTGISKVEIDNLIWSFCADGFGEICTAKPKCEICPIKDWCRKA